MLPTRDDLQFILFDWLKADNLALQENYAHCDRESIDAMLDAALDLAEAEFLSHAAKSDATPPVFENGEVRLIPEIGRALKAYQEAGFFGLQTPLDEGGLGLPYTVVSAIGSIFSCANVATNGYAFLTQAAANLIREVASESQKRRYLPAMAEGRWYGTMCLSEPPARAWPTFAPSPNPCRTGAMRCAAIRCGSAVAITNWLITSCIWCWRKCRAARPVPRAFHCSLCPSGMWMNTVWPVRAMA